MQHRTALTAALAGAALAMVPAAPAAASSIPQRTYLGSSAPGGAPGNGASAHPVLSASGRVLAFDTTATTLAGTDANGAVRDVVAIDLATNERRLVSAPPGLPAADGPSSEPTMSANGQLVAFVSSATNLVFGDVNGAPDIFARLGRDPLQLVSVGPGGVRANGPSSEPDVSADGNRVVFTSSASNLVPGDTNAQADVFVRDLKLGVTQRVSVGPGGVQAAGRSMSPAISADGRYVAFTSGAPNLVARDTNGVMDVFVRDLQAQTTERVSISSTGRQQNASVAPPFVQIPDISQDGRYVVFDSDGTTLTANDTNRHTDVFLRDRRKKTTTLVSASSTNVQGDNDSFAPRLGPDGRFLSFQSFATNLAPGGGPREDIFVRDLRQGTTSVVNVTADGTARGPEQVPQLLQRPSISRDGRFAAFSSTVTNLVPGDANAAEDVFVRLMDAPEGRIVAKPAVGRSGTVRLAADDPLAASFVCQIDGATPFICGPSFKVRPFGRVLTARVGGPGMLYSSEPLRIRLSNDHRAPTVRIAPPRGPFSTIRGRATDASGLRTLEIGVVFSNRKGCTYLRTRSAFARQFTRKNCNVVRLIQVTPRQTWRVKLPRRIRNAYYVVYVRAVDGVGNVSRVAVRRGIVR